MNIGLLNINKPKGITSHDVIQKLRTLTGIKKIGHTGTLDPVASGVLVVAIGKATKLIEYLEEGEKNYIATMKLGYTSKTLDTESEPVPTNKKISLNSLNWDKILKKYIGKIEQIPPDFSAVKINGHRAYKLASQNQNFNIAPRVVDISNIKILEINSPMIRIEVTCKRGTYIRSLVRDIGDDIEVGAIMTDLIRIENNGFRIENSLDFEKLSLEKIENKLINIHEVFKDKAILLGKSDLIDISFGRYLKLDREEKLLIAFDITKNPVAVLVKSQNLYRPTKVLIDQF